MTRHLLDLLRSLPARSPSLPRQVGVHRVWTSALLNPRGGSRSEERDFNRVNPVQWKISLQWSKLKIISFRAFLQPS